jgi:hypothetical protein
MNSIVYGSAIILCGIFAAFVVHEVFRWGQKKADLTESKLDDIVLYSLDKPLSIAIIVGSVWLAITLFVDPEALLGEYAWLLSEKYFAAVGNTQCGVGDLLVCLQFHQPLRQVDGVTNRDRS